MSGGAACASGKAEASHVLVALGIDEADAQCAIRISIGRTTTEREVDEAAQQLVAAARQLASRRPLARAS